MVAYNRSSIYDASITVLTICIMRADNMTDYIRQLQRFNVGEDCPVFDGMFEFCQTYTSGSIGGAVRLNEDMSDIVINWSGGLHHAKKSEASGFCYVNDCVLAILELLKKHQRVLYIDIDIHHGDGVEEAFYTTNRVMTCSFHKFGEYFPGTGDVKDKGHGVGENYAINVPLRDGMDDASYRTIFRPIIEKIMEKYQPGAIVLQCGADSLSGDRLGCFKLSIQGHADCVSYVKSFNVPTLVLGGGGYTLRNVPRCWLLETSVILDTPVSDAIPFNDYLEYYGPEYKLHLPVSNMENLNTPKYLDKVKIQVLQILDKVIAVPGTQIYTGQVGTTQIPPSMSGLTTSDSRSGKGTVDSYRDPKSHHPATDIFSSFAGSSSQHHKYEETAEDRERERKFLADASKVKSLTGQAIANSNHKMTLIQNHYNTRRNNEQSVPMDVVKTEELQPQSSASSSAASTVLVPPVPQVVARVGVEDRPPNKSFIS